MASLKKDLESVIDAHLGKGLGTISKLKEQNKKLKEQNKRLKEQNKELRGKNAELVFELAEAQKKIRESLKPHINAARKAAIAMTEMTDG